MKYILIFLIFYTNLYSKSPLIGWLNGKVSTFDNKGKQKPIIGKVIKLSYENSRFSAISKKTDSQGNFHIEIKKEQPIALGKKLYLTIEGIDYFILSPYNGEMFPPETLNSYELNMIVVSNNSKVQTGPLYSIFTNKDRSKAYQKHIYTVQVLFTSIAKKALTAKKFFINKGYDCFIESTREEYGLIRYRVYVSSSNNKKKANQIRKSIKKISRTKYPEAFVKSILH